MAGYIGKGLQVRNVGTPRLTAGNEGGPGQWAPLVCAVALQHVLAGLVTLPEPARPVAQRIRGGNAPGFVLHFGGLRGQPGSGLSVAKQTLCQREDRGPRAVSGQVAAGAIGPL